MHDTHPTHKVDLLFAGGDIKRYHLKNTIKEQTVAAHSWGVAVLATTLWPNARAELLHAALVHDISELATGDIPSPVKRANPILKVELNRVTTEYEQRHGLRLALTVDEAAFLRWCDLMEGVRFCVTELTYGNRHMIATLTNYLNASQAIPEMETFPTLTDLAGRAVMHSVRKAMLSLWEHYYEQAQRLGNLVLTD